VLKVPGLAADLEDVLWRVAAARLGEARLRPRALAPAIQELSRRYTTDREHLTGAAAAALLAARLLFFGPSDAPKAGVALGELAAAGVLPARRPLRVLDAGAGVGAMTLGLLAFLREAGGPPALEVTALDGDGPALALGAAALAAAASLAGAAARVVTRVADVRREEELPAGPFDLVLAGSVLNELWPGAPDRHARRAALAGALARRLAPDGALIVIEPALREVTRDLEEVRTLLLAAGLTVFAPCPHAAVCPMLARERDWCHEARRLEPSPHLAALTRLTGLRQSEVRFAYLTLRLGGPTLAAARAAAWRTVSHPLPGKGKTTLDLCGDGRRVRVERLTRDRAAHNEALDEAARGDLLSIDPLPGPGEAVRLGGETRVERR
jgi:ribosomal protein RSM22 (predicted rRNA methylase)